MFGSDAAQVSKGKPQKNARVLIATYQTLGVDTDEADATFLTSNYPVNYFSHIVIDECHRSAWGKWSEVLKRNPDAVQIGLTATPRELKIVGKSHEAQLDKQITADNIKHFGEPVYEYDMSQGIEDGYLAACVVEQFDLFHDNKAVNERQSPIRRDDLKGKRVVDARTGQEVLASDIKSVYGASEIEDHILIPERVAAMCGDLFQRLVENGGPEQKTIIFCTRDRHADDVASVMNNLYADWCRQQGKKRAEDFAFKCTEKAGGADMIADFKGGARHHFIATTVELLTTGVDVPPVKNIVFFKYVRSPLAFYQMIGRGTRIHTPTGKLMFQVYDYTDATRLFGGGFITRSGPSRKKTPGPPPPGGPPTIMVEGFEVRVTPAGKCIVTQVDGKAMPVTVEEYKERLAAKLVEEVSTLESFRKCWVAPRERKALLGKLPDAGRSPLVVRQMRARDAVHCVVSSGEILVARSNTPDLVGRVAMFEGNPPGVVASDLTIRIRTKENIETPFLTAYLSFLYLSGYWKDRAGGASGTMKKITRTQILNERIPVPSIEDQRLIVGELSERMTAVKRLHTGLAAQLAKMNALPSSLLNQAFSGKL